MSTPFRLKNWVTIFQCSKTKWAWRPYGVNRRFETHDDALADAVAWARDRYESEIDSEGVDIVPYEKRRDDLTPLQELGIYVQSSSGRRVIRSRKSLS